MMVTPVQLQKEAAKVAKRRTRVGYVPGPYIPLRNTEALRSLYEYGDCMMVDGNGNALYVPAQGYVT